MLFVWYWFIAFCAIFFPLYWLAPNALARRLVAPLLALEFCNVGISVAARVLYKYTTFLGERLSRGVRGRPCYREPGALRLLSKAAVWHE